METFQVAEIVTIHTKLFADDENLLAMISSVQHNI
jgi:hypothetical protein